MDPTITKLLTESLPSPDADVCLLIHAIRIDTFPSSHRVRLQFGIATLKHFQVLAEAYKSGDLSVADLEEAADDCTLLNEKLWECDSLCGVVNRPIFSVHALGSILQ